MSVLNLSGIEVILTLKRAVKAGNPSENFAVEHD